MLDELSDLVGSIPKDKLGDLTDELYRGLGGQRYELQSLIDSSSKLAGDFSDLGDTTRTLIEDAEPLLSSQVRSADAIEIWSRSLAGVTDQLRINDPQIRAILASGPGFSDEVTSLLESVEFTLPILLANLTSVGQLAVTYNAALEQLLVLLPPSISMIQAVQPKNNAVRTRSGRLPDQWHLGSAGLHGRVPAAGSVASTLGHHHHRHTGRAVLQVAAGFRHRGAGCAQHPVPRQSGQAGGDSRIVQQRRGIRAGLSHTTAARQLSARSEPAERRASRPAWPLRSTRRRTGTYVGPDGALYQQTDLAGLAEADLRGRVCCRRADPVDQTGSKAEIFQVPSTLVSVTRTLLAVNAGSGLSVLVVVWLMNTRSVAESFIDVRHCRPDDLGLGVHRILLGGRCDDLVGELGVVGQELAGEMGLGGGEIIGECVRGVRQQCDGAGIGCRDRRFLCARIGCACPGRTGRSRWPLP